MVIGPKSPEDLLVGLDYLLHLKVQGLIGVGLPLVVGPAVILQDVRHFGAEAEEYVGEQADTSNLRLKGREEKS